MDTPRLFEMYSKRVWPVHKLITRKLYRRCVKCAISERASKIEGGICTECQEYRGRKPDEITEKQVSKACTFRRRMDEERFSRLRWCNVLVLLSGGKDSAWLAHYITTNWPMLDVLCLAIDNGFMNPTALSNAKQVCDRLKLPLMVHRPPPVTFSQPLGNAFLKAVTSGCYGTVDKTDGDLTHEIGIELARNLGISTVATGLSWVQVERIFGVEDVVIPFGEANDPVLYAPLWAMGKSEDEILRDVVRSGLLEAANVSPLATNQTLITLMGAVDVCNLGYSSFEPEFCTMIREGKADPVKWSRIFSLLEYCGRTGFLIKPTVRVLLKRLGLTGGDVGIPWA